MKQKIDSSPMILSDSDVVRIGTFKGTRAEWKALTPDARDRHFAAIGAPVTVTIPRRGNCPRCSGTGYLSGYGHVQGGRCFRCGGSGGRK